MAKKVLKKAVAKKEEVKEEKVVSKKEEVVKPKKTVAKKTSAKPKAKAKEEAVAKVAPNHKYPAEIKGDKVLYTRNDSLDAMEIKKLVESSAQYPVRVMMQEDREVVTEFAVLYVGKEIITCVDVNSPENSENFEGLLRFNMEQFAEREVDEFKFAIYTRKLEG